MTTVKYGLRYTRNTGNFENVTPYFEITDEVRDGENIDEAKSRIAGKVEQWMLEKINEVEKDIGK